jgi:protein PhnA
LSKVLIGLSYFNSLILWLGHFFCKGGCGSTLDELSVCESAEEEMIVKDANGNILKDGDSVSLIKDLTLRGSSTVIKVGTKVSKIRLTDDPEEVNCKINGTAIVLRVEFLKKL